MQGSEPPRLAEAGRADRRERPVEDVVPHALVRRLPRVRAPDRAAARGDAPLPRMIPPSGHPGYEGDAITPKTHKGITRSRVERSETRGRRAIGHIHPGFAPLDPGYG